MKTILKENNQYVLRFEKGEEVMSSLKGFCKREGISSGFFNGLGATSSLKLASYNPATKSYSEKEFNQDLEIANLTGDVSMSDGELIVHMHGTFADEQLKAIAGHVLSVVISATCEMMLTRFEQPMNRKFNDEVGLKLLEGLE